MRVLIVGCGYVGVATGALLSSRGHSVLGLRRSRNDDTVLANAGIKPVHCDITRREQLDQLPGPFDWVVNCASSGRAGADVFRQVYLQGTLNLIDWLRKAPPAKYVYTSSTSVYAQDDGSWVTESSPAVPESETGRILAETERVVLEAAGEINAVILRVTGIYGPSRGYLFRQYLNGEATIGGDGSRHLNMIHRDDVAGAILAALERGSPGRIYNVCDNEPVRQIDFFHWLSETLKRPMPPVATVDESRRKRAVTNKRVSNARLRSELKFDLNYPTFREGYGKLIETDAPPAQPDP